MTDTPRWRIIPPRLQQVRLTGGPWAHWQRVNREVALPRQYEFCETSGRIDQLRIDSDRKAEGFAVAGDSDVAKWLEAAAYVLAASPDDVLRQRVERVIDLFEELQQPDGYLNSYYQREGLDKRWTNLRDMHELYNVGHLMEAAAAHHEATGETRFVDMMRRCADHIDSRFGVGPGQARGYPGHEEIELALAKLSHATGERRYLDLAKYFVDERGRQPHYWQVEAEARGETPQKPIGPPDYNQSHVPVREQTTAEGHAVRAMYLFAGMADIAAETADASLLEACRTLWQNTTQRRMYVTGGLGSRHDGERFTCDHHLPNDAAYAETCAAIGLVLFADRMLRIEADARYADVLERALYNGVLAGFSHDGTGYFYANPLSVDPTTIAWRSDLHHKATHRQAWFGCPCCPSNLARLIASLGRYAYGQSDDAAWVHLYGESAATLAVAGGHVTLTQSTGYPWDGEIAIDVEPSDAARFSVALRIPGWCEAAAARVNGEALDVAASTERGYLRIEREWRPGDRVELSLPMPPRRIYADAAVAADAGRVVLTRGPLVYCLEACHNGAALHALSLPRNAAIEATHQPNLLGGITTLTAEGRRDILESDGGLYRSTPPAAEPARLSFVPYALWANREPGAMAVWVREAVG